MLWGNYLRSESTQWWQVPAQGPTHFQAISALRVLGWLGLSAEDIPLDTLLSFHYFPDAACSDPLAKLCSISRTQGKARESPGNLWPYHMQRLLVHDSSC